MAITKNNTIPAVSLAHNPIKLELTSDNHYSTAGSVASLVLEIAAPDVTADHGFTLAWGDESITFVAKASPDGSGTQFLTTAADAAAQIANLVAVFKANYYISRDFVITYDASSITLTAKEKGTTYSLTISSITLTSLTEGTNTAGVNPVAREFFEVLTQIYLPDGTLLGEDVLTPDADGDADFDVSAYLRTQLQGSSAFMWPENDTVFLINRSAACIQFFLKYGEKYGGVVYGLTSTEDDDNFALNGGYDTMEKARMYEQDSDFLEQINYTWQFLTHQPASKVIDYNSPEKLFYLVWKSDTTTIKLKVKIYYTDDTDTTVTPDTESVSQYQVWECVVSPAKLDLDSENPTKTIDYLEVWIDDQDDARISKVHTYTIDTGTHENTRYLLFRNSLGMFDVVRFTGIREDGLEHGRQIDVFSPSDTYDKIQTPAEIREQQTFSINTGWLADIEALHWMRDLLLSPEVYEIINYRLYPAVILNSKTLLKRDKEELYSLVVDYQRAYTDQHYSRDTNAIPDGSYAEDFDDSFAHINDIPWQ